MQIPLQVTYRHVEKTEAIESLVQEKVQKLQQVCSQLNSCRVAIERAQVHPDSGSPFSVRIDMTVPPHHELCVTKSPDVGKQYVPLDAVIRDAFDAARHRLAELNERQHDHMVKDRPEQEAIAIVTALYPEQGYGILKSLEGDEVYFNRNSIVNGDFDRLKIGTGVQCVARVAEGDIPFRASTVRVVNQPNTFGVTDSAEPIEPPT